jgi:DNA-directed RNA polymerase subunit RPC12/RpoP
MEIKVGDSVCWNGECGIIMQVGRNNFSDRQVKIHWMNGSGYGLTTSWEYARDAVRMRQKYLDFLNK